MRVILEVEQELYLCSIISHSDDRETIIIKLPSGARKTLPIIVRAIIGIAAAEGRIDKPILKAGVNFYKWRVIFMAFINNG